MIKGSTKPAIRRGIPKIKPTVLPLPNVRLITRPAMKRIKPRAILKEKL